MLLGIPYNNRSRKVEVLCNQCNIARLLELPVEQLHAGGPVTDAMHARIAILQGQPAVQLQGQHFAYSRHLRLFRKASKSRV